MKVFLSWSGTRSHKVAAMLHDWLSLVIQALEPWVSSSDIERGSQWNNKINKELEASSQGVFCLTAENKEAPWILFEAGSLAKGQDTSRVYTLLIDIKPSEVTGPLVQFNHTQPTKSEMRLLVGNLNERLGDNRLNDAVLNRSFENAWPKFEADFKKIISETEANTPVKDSRGEKEIMSEVLEIVRNFDRRFAGLEQLTRRNMMLTDHNSRELNLNKDLLNRWVNQNTLINRPTNGRNRAKISGPDNNEPDPVLSEIWNSMKEGMDDDDIRQVVMDVHGLTIEEATGQVLKVRKMLEEVRRRE